MLSPKSFEMYAGILGQQLNKLMLGCCMKGKVSNHLYYTEDLVLLSPNLHRCTPKFFNECKKYLYKYEMKFNGNTSVVINFELYAFRATQSAKLYLNGSILKTDNHKKYLGRPINNNLHDHKPSVAAIKWVTMWPQKLPETTTLR